MVFESTLSTVLNKFLGNFVENLDGKQLSVGIWGGDVQLTDLVIKPSALDELDLPIQTIYGSIGKLLLKIPWKSLYTSPWIIEVSDIFLLAVPNQQVVYDPVKEEKQKFEAKNKELLNYEEKKKAEAAKGKPKPDATFVEKLITTVIKNVQLRIMNIHIRYEDKITRPESPFACGISLHTLLIESTDANWKKAICDDMVKIYKIVSLEALSVYWNCNTKLYGNKYIPDMISFLRSTIGSKNEPVKDFNYVMGPINASARLRMNQSPEDDRPEFSIPKIQLNLEMEKLFIGLSKAQYRDIISLVESLDRMGKAAIYRKYRPDLSEYKGHYKEWWRFAYTCILEEVVRRRRKNWDWNHMLAYRNRCTQYNDLYRKELRKATNKEEKQILEECVRVLDINSLIILRQQAEIEVERTVALESREDKGWLSWMRKGSSATRESQTNLVNRFESDMTPEEKAKLYQAIGYQEGSGPTIYPKTFVGNSLTFLLKRLQIEIRDDDNAIKKVLFTEMSGVGVKLEHRPGANAIKVDVKIDDLLTQGLEHDNFVPRLIFSDDKPKNALVLITFETNPPDELFDQSVHVEIFPLKIIYDALTINKVIDVFQIPPDTSFDPIQDVAGSGLNNMREMTATGLQYAVEKHPRLDIFVDVQAPYIMIPYGGQYTGFENVLVANLGRLKILSDSHRERHTTVQALFEQGFKQEDILSQMKEQSYEQFVLELTDLQILIAQGDENWLEVIHQSAYSPMHLLSPLSLTIHISKCLISDDPRLPLNKINGKLASIDIKLSEARLMLLAALATSIPLPSSDVPESQILARTSSSMSMIYKGLQDSAKETKNLVPNPSKLSLTTDVQQYTMLEGQFVLSGLSVTLNQQATLTSEITELATFKIQNLQCDLTQKTYIFETKLVLSSISLEQQRLGKRVSLINSPNLGKEDEYLFKVEFTQVDPQNPEMHTKYKSVEKTLMLDFGILNIVLHQECLLALMAFSTSVQNQIADVMGENQPKDRMASTGTETKMVNKRQQSMISGSQPDLTEEIRNVEKRTNLVFETVKLAVVVELQEVTVKFATDKKDISLCSIKGIVADVNMKVNSTAVNANLQDITLNDLNPDTYYNLILSHNQGTALKTQIVIYNVEVESEQPDMTISLKMCGARIIFLNVFVSAMLNFLEKFQEPQKMIIEASQAAAQQAKENMKNMYAKATKVALDIDVKAPDIIIPVHSKNHNALLLDLGQITLSNTFLTLDKRNEKGFAAVIDELKISLSNFLLARISMDAQSKAIQTMDLLEPVTLAIIVRRNLSAGWFHDIPDMYVTGKIESINVQMSQGDYQMIMSTLNENLSEGQTKSYKENEVKVTVDLPTALITEELVHVEYGPVCRTTLTKEIKATVTLKFTFSMNALILNLYSGGDAWDIKQNPSLSPKAPLARFSLEGLSLKGRMMSDNAMVTTILLVNCLLDDMRKGREDKLNRLIQRSIPDQERGDSTKETVAPPRGMIDITYQQRENDIFVDVRIYSFTIIISVDYLLKLGAFFSTEKKIEIAVEHKETQTKSAPVSKDASFVASHHSAPKLPKEPPQMTINLKLEKPDIILVEHMDNIDTNAMILNGEIFVKLRLAGSHQVINGNIMDLQLYTCNYNPEHRAETKGNFLHPMNISIAGSTPEDRGLHIEVIITDIRICVSPATIELLNRVLVTMTSSGELTEGDEEEQFNLMSLWQQKRFTERDYWFLRTDLAQEANELVTIPERSQLKKVLNELCIITVPSIIFTLEAGVGNKTLPMILLETGFKGAARNWSSQLSFEASLTLQMGYYNSTLALWEPLIEPVEVESEGQTIYVPWELKVELSMADQDEALPTSPTTSDSDGDSLPPPVLTIDVSSEHTLEMTVTTTCLEVLRNLSKAFATAMETSSVAVATPAQAAPYKIVNEIGEDVTLLLKDGAFKFPEISQNRPSVDLSKSASVPLELKKADQGKLKLHIIKELKKRAHKQDKFLHIKVNSTNSKLALPIGRADKRFFLLNYRGEGNGNDNWGLISDVKIDEGVTIITLRSIIKVYNHFHIPIDVYYMTPKGNELELIGVAQPDGTLNVPLKAVYTPTKELFFAVSGHSITSNPYVWKDLETNVSVKKVLECPHKDVNMGKGPFIIKCIGTMKQVYFEQTMRHTMASTCYNIHLRPAVIFKNCIPYDVVCCVDEQADEINVKAGDTLQLPNVHPGKNILVIRIPEYLEKEWSCREEVRDDPEEFSVWTFHSYDSPTKMSLELGLHTQNKDGSLTMALYCPFWLLNKTGLMLGYRKSKKTAKHEAVGSPAKESDEHLNVMHHPPHFKGPILFSFNARNFFGKKKASVRVELGDWSDKFSLDVAGSSGVINCIANNRDYQIGVHNQLTYNTLTKQITFTPYYVIINNAPYTIECQENDRPADHWLAIEPKSCKGLWPISTLDDKLLRIRVAGTDEISSPFLYTESHTTLLRLNNKYGGINIDIQITEGAVYINMAHYQPGSAPALLVNYTDSNIVFWEKESVQKRYLEPNNSILYTWENPSGPRQLVWDKGNNKEIIDDLRRDTCGEFSPKKDKKVYWASFLDGLQRVLLFTDVKMIAESAEASNLLELIQQEINVSIHGIGLSLVNNLMRQEIMYLGVASSGVLWQSCKMNSKRYKNMSLKTSTHLENSYQYHLHKQVMDEDEADNLVNIDGKMMVDFRQNLIIKPNKRKLRRRFQTGLWLQMKSSPNQMQLHAKINRLQIDNQSFDCIFPVVLAPVPPPKSVAIDSGIKPFVEVSIVQLLLKNSQIKQYKYFKVLIQEFDIKVDLGFVNAILQFLQEKEQSEEEEKKLFLEDMHLVEEALYVRASGESLKQQKSFYDLLHFSPLKIHISFSMAASSSAPGQSVQAPNFLNILLQGLGVTLTDLQDVIFKLAFFERSFTFLTQQQLVNEVTKHYIGQSVKQLYVLVLGLDVIGNPFGLVLGITKGVEDLFYEPIQGAIQGPGEFAEGVALGVKSLFGHTVGGAAGAVSRITGAMGKGIAVLTFDEDYQRKRRDELNKKPATAAEGIARSGKGLVMGVVSGVTGVVTKPVSGAREQGVEGFFKGLGKGAVGLVTRPVAGVVDFASGSLDVVKRCAEVGEDVVRLRSPRFLPSDGLVKPYNSKEAHGHKLLMELSKGKYACTDIYASHYEMIEGKEVLLLTDKRIAYICHNDIFGGWQVDWAYTWNELSSAPKIVPKGVVISATERKKRLFGSSDTTKTLLIGDPEMKEEICLTIESLRET